MVLLPLQKRARLSCRTVTLLRPPMREIPHNSESFQWPSPCPDRRAVLEGRLCACVGGHVLSRQIPAPIQIKSALPPKNSTRKPLNPDPPNPCFFGKKEKKGKPRKKQGFLSSWNPSNPWKRKEKCPKMQGKSENEKKQGNRKKQGLEGQGI